MFYRASVALSVTILMFFAISSCSAVVTALLARELLDDKAPRRQWRGTVVDRSGFGIEDALVIITAEVTGDDEIVTFDDLTNEQGEYDIKFRWHEDIRYTVAVELNGRIVADKYEGRVELYDQTSNFSIDTFQVSATLFGVVSDWRGDPLSGILVVGGTVDSPGDVPDILLDGDSHPVWDTTDSEGFFELDGSLMRYGVVCAYHPDFGWAYAYDDDKRANGGIELNARMGKTGAYTVQVQVVDNSQVPIANQILSADRRFRVRFDQPFDLSDTIDVVSDSEDLFPDLTGFPSVSHPDRYTMEILATGDNGFGEDFSVIEGGNYHLELLEVGSSNPATAILVSENPLVLHETTVLTVRVN